jgi:hypothetical protein
MHGSGFDDDLPIIIEGSEIENLFPIYFCFLD